jgi:hypothetical protein
MSYARKTKDVWYILVNYGHGWEHELTEESWKDARAQMKCYRENCPQYPVRSRRTREKLSSLSDLIALDPALIRR